MKLLSEIYVLEGDMNKVKAGEIWSDGQKLNRKTSAEYEVLFDSLIEERPMRTPQGVLAMPKSANEFMRYIHTTFNGPMVIATPAREMGSTGHDVKR